MLTIPLFIGFTFVILTDISKCKNIIQQFKLHTLFPLWTISSICTIYCCFIWTFGIDETYYKFSKTSTVFEKVEENHYYVIILNDSEYDCYKTKLYTESKELYDNVEIHKKYTFNASRHCVAPFSIPSTASKIVNLQEVK